MPDKLKGYDDDVCRLIRSKRDDEIITVLGPTATGKTRLAVRIARDFGAEIISADSRQVYRGMDIGTGKDLDDYMVDGQVIPYHLIDIAEPGVEYNVAQYQQAAYVAMDAIRARGREIVLCGGSGMYIEALLGGFRLAPITRDPKDISDVLDMTVNQAVEFLDGLENPPRSAVNAATKLKYLQDVGLGYLKMGQPSHTLSGGEAQRVKLAFFLSQGDNRQNVLFIFDEPTTGLHFHDINKLYHAFNRLIEKGNSIIVIEHNPELIKCADWVIDLGPDLFRSMLSKSV